MFQETFTGGGDFHDRPALTRLFTYLDKYPYRNYVVVFDDIKRLARETTAHIQLRVELKARNARPESPNFAFDDSPEGQFIETIHAAQAQLEREQNKRQVVQKMKARLEAGYWCLGGAKRGYAMNPTTRIHEPSEEGLSVLRPALEGFANGTLVRKVDVARYLVERGFWKNQAAEKYSTLVDKLLKDPFYAGYVEYLDWEVERRQGRHIGLISESTFAAIQTRLRRPHTSNWVRQDISSDFPLRGLVTCVCGEKLTAAFSKSRNGNKYPYYLCKGSDCEFRNKSIRKDLIETDFAKAVKSSNLRKEVGNVVEEVFNAVWKQEEKDAGRRETSVISEIKKLKEKLGGLSDLAYKAKNSHIRDIYEKQMEQVAHEIEALEGQISGELDLFIPYQTALSKSKQLIKSPYSIWQKLDAREQHGLYYFLFEAKLAYHPKEGFQTANIATAAKLFEDFAAVNSSNVDRTGFEPATLSLQMRCSTN